MLVAVAVAVEVRDLDPRPPASTVGTRVFRPCALWWNSRTVFNIQLQGITVRAPTTLFSCVFVHLFSLFFLVDVSTPSLGADPPEAACTGGLHPGGTAPQL